MKIMFANEGYFRVVDHRDLQFCSKFYDNWVEASVLSPSTEAEADKWRFIAVSSP